MQLETIKAIAELTTAKVKILEIKADHYKWWGILNDDDREQLEQALSEINEQLAEIKKNS